MPINLYFSTFKIMTDRLQKKQSTPYHKTATIEQRETILLEAQKYTKSDNQCLYPIH